MFEAFVNYMRLSFTTDVLNAQYEHWVQDLVSFNIMRLNIFNSGQFPVQNFCQSHNLGACFYF